MENISSVSVQDSISLLRLPGGRFAAGRALSGSSVPEQRRAGCVAAASQEKWHSSGEIM